MALFSVLVIILGVHRSLSGSTPFPAQACTSNGQFVLHPTSRCKYMHCTYKTRPTRQAPATFSMVPQDCPLGTAVPEQLYLRVAAGEQFAGQHTLCTESILPGSHKRCQAPSTRPHHENAPWRGAYTPVREPEGKRSRPRSRGKMEVDESPHGVYNVLVKRQLHKDMIAGSKFRKRKVLNYKFGHRSGGENRKRHHYREHVSPQVKRHYHGPRYQKMYHFDQRPSVRKRYNEYSGERGSSSSRKRPKPKYYMQDSEEQDSLGLNIKPRKTKGSFYNYEKRAFGSKHKPVTFKGYLHDSRKHKLSSSEHRSTTLKGYFHGSGEEKPSSSKYGSTRTKDYFPEFDSFEDYFDTDSHEYDFKPRKYHYDDDLFKFDEAYKTSEDDSKSSLKTKKSVESKAFNDHPDRDYIFNSKDNSAFDTSYADMKDTFPQNDMNEDKQQMSKGGNSEETGTLKWYDMSTPDYGEYSVYDRDHAMFVKDYNNYFKNEFQKVGHGVGRWERDRKKGTSKPKHDGILAGSDSKKSGSEEYTKKDRHYKLNVGSRGGREDDYDRSNDGGMQWPSMYKPKRWWTPGSKTKDLTFNTGSSSDVKSVTSQESSHGGSDSSSFGEYGMRWDPYRSFEDFGSSSDSYYMTTDNPIQHEQMKAGHGKINGKEAVYSYNPNPGGDWKMSHFDNSYEISRDTSNPVYNSPTGQNAKVAALSRTYPFGATDSPKDDGYSAVGGTNGDYWNLDLAPDTYTNEKDVSVTTAKSSPPSLLFTRGIKEITNGNANAEFSKKWADKVRSSEDAASLIKQGNTGRTWLGLRSDIGSNRNQRAGDPGFKEKTLVMETETVNRRPGELSRPKITLTDRRKKLGLRSGHQESYLNEPRRVDLVKDDDTTSDADMHYLAKNGEPMAGDKAGGGGDYGQEQKEDVIRPAPTHDDTSVVSSDESKEAVPWKVHLDVTDHDVVAGVAADTTQRSPDNFDQPPPSGEGGSHGEVATPATDRYHPPEIAGTEEVEPGFQLLSKNREQQSEGLLVKAYQELKYPPKPV